MSDGSRHSLAYVEESTYGTTPSNPVFTPIRHKSCSLALKKGAVESEEIRADRQLQDFRHGTTQVGGDIEMELAYDINPDLFEAVMCKASTPNRTTGVTTLSASGATFTRAAGSFTTDAFTNQVIIASGFTNAGNNGRFRITTVASGALTVTPLDGQTMTTETGNGDELIIAERWLLKASTTRKSFTMERKFADMSGSKQYHRFTGCEIASMKLSVTPDKIVSLSFGIVGKGLTLDNSIVSGATYSAGQTTVPMNSFNGTITEGGSAIAIITEIQLTLENGLEPRYIVGSSETIRPAIGRSKCSGQLTAYFEDVTLLEKFLNETESSVSFELFDAAGNSYAFTIPRIKYTGGQPDVKGEGPVTLSLPFQALYSTADVTQLKIEGKPV